MFGKHQYDFSGTQRIQLGFHLRLPRGRGLPWFQRIASTQNIQRSWKSPTHKQMCLKTWHESLKIGSLPTLVRSFWPMASCISVSTSLHTPVTLKKSACGSITTENRTTTPTKDHSKYKSNVNKRHLICFLKIRAPKNPRELGHTYFHWMVISFTNISWSRCWVRPAMRVKIMRPWWLLKYP